MFMQSTATEGELQFCFLIQTLLWLKDYLSQGSKELTLPRQNTLKSPQSTNSQSTLRTITTKPQFCNGRYVFVSRKSSANLVTVEASKHTKVQKSTEQNLASLLKTPPAPEQELSCAGPLDASLTVGERTEADSHLGMQGPIVLRTKSVRYLLPSDFEKRAHTWDNTS